MDQDKKALMTSSTHDSEMGVMPAQTKQLKAYVCPQLHRYGSIGELTKNGNGSGADGGPTAGMTMVSDINTKENLVRIANHPLGIGLYLFDYKPEFQAQCGHGRQFGVMAQEVEAVMPEAVCTHPNGYKMVNYAMLGITHVVH